MQELSLNVLDIAQNSVKAGSTEIRISLEQQGASLTITVKDNGCGMSDEQLERVCDPFFTSRTTRAVGLGIPFFKMAAEQTGGSFSITSKVSIGTTVTAVFQTDHIDCMPIGNMADTVFALISCNEHIDFFYRHTTDKGCFEADTLQLREILEGVSFSEPSVATFLRAYFKENIEEISL